MQQKIIHIIEATATGTLAMASLLANEQAEKGHIVEIIYSIRKETPKEIESMFSKKIKLTNIQMRGGQALNCIFKLRKNIIKKKTRNSFSSLFICWLSRANSIIMDK